MRGKTNNTKDTLKGELLYTLLNYRNKKKEPNICLTPFLVPRPGVEPGWVAPLVFETSASTDSAIWASEKCGAKIQTFSELASMECKKNFNTVNY